MTGDTAQQTPIEDTPEYKWRVKKAQFLVTLYEDHRAAIDKAVAVIPIAHLDPSMLGGDVSRLYFHILLGALLVQGVPPSEANILADHATTFRFNQLRLMPEPGNA